MRRISMILFLLLSVVFLGCKPKYPNCEKDKHCSKKKPGELCVKGKCVECKDNKGCPTGQQCSGGSCEEIDGFCQSKNDCDQGELCKESRCTPGCELSGDC